ncbi:MAG: ABC transporter permease [Oscillospiraceae bacterium]|nr:ABC transporter permease [Oscillospiraceae bacterium]
MKKNLMRIISSEGALNFLSSVMAIAVGLLIGLVILLVSNASQALGAFGMILTSGIRSGREMGQVLYFATPVIMTGLSVGFANKTGLFNIGASGQFICGAYASILVGVHCTFLPGHVHWIAAILAAMAAGALWGCIPGVLKAFFNVNEVISCIMTNYIGMILVNYLITQSVYDPASNQSSRVAASAILPKMGLDSLFREGGRVSSVNGGIVIAIIFGIIVYLILSKTKFGYELKACGYNRGAAGYAGINENRCIILSMVIAGALAGLGGALQYLAGAGNAIDVKDVLAPEGFNGIPVALLGMNNPIGILFSGMLIAYLNVGGFNMQLYAFAPQVIEIMIAIIIYFSAFALLLKGFINSAGRKIRSSSAKEENVKGGGVK